MRLTRLSSFAPAALVALALTSSIPASHAQALPGSGANKCLAGKTKCVNRALEGLLRCRTACQRDPGKCDQVQSKCETRVRGRFVRYGDPTKSCFARLEARANPSNPASVCTTTGDVAAVRTQLDGLVADILGVLEDTSPSGCVLQQFPATGQTTCYDGNGNVIVCAGTGQDGDVQAGAALAYHDNGDGTVTDLSTGLMWEKKSDDGTLHDVDNCYRWRGICSGDGTTACGRDADCAGPGGPCDIDDCQVVGPNGLTIFEWVDALNAASFAGHTDWRLPNYRELVSIVDLSIASPAVAPAFNTACTSGCDVTTCSCTRSAAYWVSTSGAAIPNVAWLVLFIDGDVFTRTKSDIHLVRAVRGGL